MRTRNLTIGHKPEFRSSKFEAPAHETNIEGFYVCTICEKNLNATEAAVRSHLRKHIRQGELKKSMITSRRFRKFADASRSLPGRRKRENPTLRP